MRASGSRVAGAVVALGVAVVGCGKGAKGPQGPAGGPGGYAQAPRIFNVSPSTLSYGVTVQITGENFATVASNDEVWVNGWKGEVLLADANDLYVDHLAPPDLATPDVAPLVVVANHVPSGPFSITRMPRGSVVSAPDAAIAGIGAAGITSRDDGSVAVIQGGGVVSIAPGGDLSRYPDDVPMAPEGASWVGRADGIYFIHANDVLRWEDGADEQLVAHVTAGTPIAIAFDAAANLYILERVSAATAQVEVRKTSDFSISTVGSSFAATGPASMFFQGGNLYVGDTGTTSVLQVALPGGAVTTYASGVTAKFLTGDGAHLYTYDAGHVRQIDAGAVTQWSAKTLGGATVIGIARSAADGAFVLLTSAGVVYRMPDAATLETYGGPLAGLRAVGANGSTLYAGSTAGCGDGDSLGGVLYEVRLDGTMRRVTDGFCGSRLITVSLADGRLLWADAAAGTVMAVDGVVGGAPTPLFAPGSLVDPRFVIPLADGSLLVPNQDVNTQYRISHYDGVGTLLDAVWSPDDPDAPDAGVLAGTDVDLSYASLGQLRTVPAATGGPLVALTGAAFAPDATALSLDAANDLIVSDPVSASVWLLAPSSPPVRLARAGDSSPWFFVGDGRFVTVSADSVDLVLP